MSQRTTTIFIYHCHIDIKTDFPGIYTNFMVRAILMKGKSA